MRANLTIPYTKFTWASSLTSKYHHNCLTMTLLNDWWQPLNQLQPYSWPTNKRVLSWRRQWTSEIPSAHPTFADLDASTNIIKTQPSSELLVDHANTLPVFACRRLEKRCSLFQGQKSTEQAWAVIQRILWMDLFRKCGQLMVSCTIQFHLGKTWWYTRWYSRRKCNFKESHKSWTLLKVAFYLHSSTMKTFTYATPRVQAQPSLNA